MSRQDFDSSKAFSGSHSPNTPGSHTGVGGPVTWLAAIIFAAAIGVVYARSLDVAFVMDDNVTVVSNASIHSLWPLIGDEQHRGPLNPPQDLPTSARPLVNYSFALSYYFSKTSVTGYHVASLVIHFLNTSLLFVLVRRVLQLPYFAARFDRAAGWLAFITALLWSIHPLLTDAVAYVTQRTELMMAWFYLATLYCSLRYWDSMAASPAQTSHQRRWLILAVVACLAGMFCKEVMISAPVVVLFFDRAFVSRSFAEAFRRSWPLYLGLALTWIPLLVLSANGPRSLSAGFHLCDNPIVYWFTQCKVLLMYLKLSVWPSPLRHAYDLPHVDNPVTFVIYVVPVLLMSAGTLVLLWRNRPAGFVFFFVGAILAPTSIVPIMTEMAAERRMYLPLAALMALVIVGIYLFAKRQLTLGTRAGEARSEPKAPWLAATVSVVAVGVMYGVVSAHRLVDWHDEILLCEQVVETQPNNFGVRYQLGLLYNHAGREAESRAQLEAAVAANPNHADSRSALGFALVNVGRVTEALASIQAALDIDPNHVGALDNMGIALTRMNRYDDAIKYLERAVRIAPSHADAHMNLGKALLAAGRTTEGNEQLGIARSLTPDDPDVLFNLATSHANHNELPEAIDLFGRALELRPDFAAAHNGLGIALHRSGDARRAREHFAQFQRLRPTEPGAYFNLAIVATGEGDYKQAAALYEHAVRLRPDSPQAHFSLASALDQTGELQNAIDHYQKTLELNPGILPAYPALAAALGRANRGTDAVQVAQRGIEVAQQAGDEKTVMQLKELLSSLQARPAGQ